MRFGTSQFFFRTPEEMNVLFTIVRKRLKIRLKLLHAATDL
jgi:hypothetical protein